MKKDVVAGLGEIGLPIYKIISRNFPVYGYDIDKKLTPNNPKKFENNTHPNTGIFAALAENPRLCPVPADAIKISLFNLLGFCAA